MRKMCQSEIELNFGVIVIRICISFSFYLLFGHLNEVEHKSGAQNRPGVLERSLEYAQSVERWGYMERWSAEP